MESKQNHAHPTQRMEAAELRTDSGARQRATWIVVPVLQSRYCIELSNLLMTTAMRLLQVDDCCVRPSAPNLSQTLSRVGAENTDDGAFDRRGRDHLPVRRHTEAAQLALVSSDGLRNVPKCLLPLAPDGDCPLLLPQNHKHRSVFPLANVAQT